MCAKLFLQPLFFGACGARWPRGLQEQEDDREVPVRVGGSLGYSNAISLGLRKDSGLFLLQFPDRVKQEKTLARFSQIQWEIAENGKLQRMFPAPFGTALMQPDSRSDSR